MVSLIITSPSESRDWRCCLSRPAYAAATTIEVVQLLSVRIVSGIGVLVVGVVRIGRWGAEGLLSPFHSESEPLQADPDPDADSGEETRSILGLLLLGPHLEQCGPEWYRKGRGAGASQK